MEAKPFFRTQTNVARFVRVRWPLSRSRDCRALAGTNQGGAATTSSSRARVNEAQVILRPARWSELVFTVIALYLALSLPFPPPDGQTIFLLVHWYGMVAIAVGLTISLRRPSRTAWAVASILSAYFLFSFAVGLRAWWVLRASHQDIGPAFALAYAILGIAVLAQVDVGVRCWRARSLRTNARAASGVELGRM